MQKLVDGVHAFQRAHFARYRELFETLATRGQNPETLFITCSDSRVVPNLITGTDPGELFTIRNVGNIVPHPSLPGGTAAGIEYAVSVLGVQNIVVCGHTHCGAVRALMTPQSITQLPLVHKWLSQADRVRELVEERYAHLEGEERERAAVEENVLVQLEHLREFSFVSEPLAAGKLRLSGWVYKIETGEVYDFDPAIGQFVVMGEGRDSSLPPSVGPR
jgi:carbonic anhydrase